VAAVPSGLSSTPLIIIIIIIIINSIFFDCKYYKLYPTQHVIFASLKTAFSCFLSVFMGITGTDLNGIHIKNGFFSFVQLISSFSLSQSQPYKNLKQKITFMKCYAFKWGGKVKSFGRH
jgi:hypothetical protein